MTINYVFDVDGTLTPSRGSIDPYFKMQFESWMRHKKVYFVTGSDAEKTIEQVGRDLWSKVVSYQCCGNEIYAHGYKVYEMLWGQAEDGGELDQFLEKLLAESPYPVRCGTHIEKRKGLVNFSTVGRECTQEQRKAYLAWDSEHKERLGLCRDVIERFPNVEASIGGEISIDIYPAGRNKGQVARYLQQQGPIYFFGDKTEPGGNDFPLARLLDEPPHRVYQVSGPEDTLRILKGLR